MGFEVGDRVQVTAGDLAGKPGTVIKVDGDRIQVQGSRGGKRTFAAAILELLPSGGTPTTLSEPSSSNGSSGIKNILTDEVEVLPPPSGGSTPTLEDRRSLLYDWLLELEAEGCLNAWIESENRGGRSLYRIVYHATEKREPHRVSGKHVHQLRQQIERGKLVRHIRALLRAIAD